MTTDVHFLMKCQPFGEVSHLGRRLVILWHNDCLTSDLAPSHTPAKNSFELPHRVIANYQVTISRHGEHIG